jgi:hypothetical protein
LCFDCCLRQQVWRSWYLNKNIGGKDVDCCLCLICFANNNMQWSWSQFADHATIHGPRPQQISTIYGPQQLWMW